MDFPADLLFTKDHEWALHQGKDDTVIVGITAHAQEALGEIVYVELPKTDRELKEHETFGVVESIKAVSDLYCPVPGKVLETNSGVTADPSLINRDPYKEGWLIKLKLSDKSALSKLMNAAQYKAYVDGLK